MIDIAWARNFAQDWVAAWNAGDLEKIFAHYADDFEMTSPLIVERMGVANGTLKGKLAIKPYWAQGLAAKPPIRFELIDVLAGVNSVAIYYRNIARDKFVVERWDFSADRLAVRSEAFYRAA